MSVSQYSIYCGVLSRPAIHRNAKSRTVPPVKPTPPNRLHIQKTKTLSRKPEISRFSESEANAAKTALQPPRSGTVLTGCREKCYPAQDDGAKNPEIPEFPSPSAFKTSIFHGVLSRLAFNRNARMNPAPVKPCGKKIICLLKNGGF